jgi:hypothetical protein
MLKIDSCL